MNLPATRMQLEDNAIRVYEDAELVAFLDVSVILCAHISERKDTNA